MKTEALTIKLRTSRLRTHRHLPALVLVGLLALAGILVGGYVHTYRTIGPLDELQHIDYLYRAVDGEIVASGDKFEEEAMRAEACRGLDAELADPLPPCDAEELRPEQFQESGFNTAYIHPPTYYVVTGTTALVVERVPGVSDFVSAGRAVGMLWLGLAVVLTWLVFSDLKVALGVRVPSIVLMICSAATLHATSTVNPDATALAAGAGALLAVLRWESGRASGVWPVLVCALAIALKATNAVGVLVALGYLAIRTLQRRRADAAHPSHGAVEGGGDGGGVVTVDARRTTGDVARVVGLALFGIAIVATVWLAVSGAIQKVDPSEIPMTKRFQVDSIGYDEIRAKLTNGFTPVKDPELPPFMQTRTIETLNEWMNVVITVGAVVGIAFSVAGSRLRAVAVAAVASCLVAGPALVVVSFWLSGIYVDNPPRYALAALPALLVACAVPLQQRVLRVIASVFAAWLAFSTLLVVWF